MLTASTITDSLLVGCVAFLLAWWLGRPRPRAMPPGPTPFPLVGNLPQLGAIPFRKMTEYSKTYGDIYTVRFGSRNIIIVNGYKTLRETFNRTVFASRPDFTMRSIIAQGESITFNDPSPTWNLHKRMMARALRNHLCADRSSMRQNIVDEADQLCRHLIEETSRHGCVDPKSSNLHTVHRIAVTSCFGPDVNLEAACAVVESRLGQLHKLFPWLMLSDFVPLTRWVLGWARRSAVTVAADLTQVFEENIAGGLASGTLSSIVGNLKAACDQSECGILAAQGLSERRVMLSVGDLIGAASDTTGSFLAWVFMYLARYRDLQERMYEDLVAAHAEEDSRLVQAFVLEVARHASVSANSVPHATGDDTELAGYHIPKGTVVIGNLHSVFMDERIFQRPEHFSPERFIDQDGSINRDLAQFVPMFGFGKRRCLGEPLAKLSIQLVIARILLNCRVAEDPKHPLDFDKSIFKLIHSPQNYHVIVTSRC